MTDRSLESLARGLLPMDHPAAAPRVRCLCCGDMVDRPHACPRPGNLGAASYTVEAPALDRSAMWTGSRFLHVLDPRPEEIDLADIARNLSRAARFAGATRGDWPAWTVADHSVLCGWLALIERRPAVVCAALMHDAAEAFLGDLVRPVKVAVPAFARIEARLLDVIAERFGLDPAAFRSPEVKRIDNLACATEAAALLPGAPRFPGLPEPAGIAVRPEGAEAARLDFLDWCASWGIA